MKKLKLFGLAALIAAGASLNSCNTVTKGCMVAADDEYNSAATEDTDPTSCDEDGTTGKYVRTNVTMNINGNSANGTYLVTIAQATADYEITITTDWGLIGPAASNFTATVTQNTATLASTSYGGGTVSGTVVYNTSTSKISITLTLAGYGSGIDGTTNDTEN